MTKTPLRAAALALVLAAAGVAGAAQAQMASPDANGDGVITRDEQSAASQARFDRMDANHDGVIDAGEVAQVKAMLGDRGARQGAMLDKLAADGGGKITKAAFMVASDARFDRMDANHDGKIDQAEMDAARAAMGGH